jgi:hypothetical protein
MKPRPLSLTIIGWALIAFGLVGFLLTLPLFSDSKARLLMEKAPIKAALQVIYIYGVAAFHVIAGFALLKGRNWGKFLYIVVDIVRISVNLVIFTTKLKVVPSIFFLAIVAFFLFRPKANAYFSSKESESEIVTQTQLPDSPASQKLWRKIIGILLYLISAFFLFSSCMLILVKTPFTSLNVALSGGFFLVSVAIFFIAWRVSTFSNWQRHLGIVMVSTAGYILFGALGVIYFMSVPEYNKAFPPNFLAQTHFNNYLSTGLYLAILFIIGILLIIKFPKNVKSQAEPTENFNGEIPADQ